MVYGRHLLKVSVVWSLIVLGLTLIVVYHNSVPRFLSSVKLVLAPVLYGAPGIRENYMQQEPVRESSQPQAKTNEDVLPRFQFNQLTLQHKRYQQVYREDCYVYHPENMTAENKCCRMYNYTTSPKVFHTCIKRIVALNPYNR